MYINARLLHFTEVPDSPPSPVSYWIKDLNLHLHDMEQLQDNKELTNQHMTAIIKIISRHFPDMPPVHSSLLERKSKSVDNLLFFHNYSGHWVLSHYKDGVVFLFDSLQPSHLHPELSKQIVDLYKDTSIVKLQQTQSQKEYKDCGCFAIAFCASILFGDDPTTLINTQSQMRQHIIACFENNFISPFPSTTRRCKRKLTSIEFSLS